MYEPKTAPCQVCGESTSYTGTKLCNFCHNVESSILHYLKTAEGRKRMREYLAKSEPKE